jgi:hypothetical protein
VQLHERQAFGVDAVRMRDDAIRESKIRAAAHDFARDKTGHRALGDEVAVLSI